MHASPILASYTLNQALWQPVYGAVLTSATLTAGQSFERLKMQTGLPDWAQFQQVPSPFDFANKATFQVPSGATDASQAQVHTSSLISLLPDIIDPEKGNLLLFSSRRQMQEVVDGLPDALAELCLVQGKSSRSRLIQQHRERIDAGEGSCLVGLASFAEGVDLPGRYLSRVIIAKLPFATPDNPIDAALAEWIERQGGNAFMQITLPDACLKLVQACGRLIRTTEDTGDIFLMDNRVLTKRYGRQFLSSLPPYKQHLG